MQDAVAAGTYYVYFDIVANGAKAANAATPINGTFEQSVGSTPTSWVMSALNAGGAQNDEVYRTALGATTTVPAGCQTTATTVDTSPAKLGAAATGQAWLLLGYRDQCEDGAEEHIRISRDIAVPAGAAAGSLTFNFQLQGWDGIANATNYDWIIVSVNGTAVNHTALGIANTTAPILTIDAGRIGRNNYSTTYLDHTWKQATLSLAAYAGTTINFRIETRHSSSDNDYRSWVKLDDVVWSLQTATAGTPQGFGVNVISPNDTAVGAASSMTAAQRLLVRAQLDATVASATADLYDNAGTLVLARDRAVRQRHAWRRHRGRPDLDQRRLRRGAADVYVPRDRRRGRQLARARLLHRTHRRRRSGLPTDSCIDRDCRIRRRSKRTSSTWTNNCSRSSSRISA